MTDDGDGWEVWVGGRPRGEVSGRYRGFVARDPGGRVGLAQVNERDWRVLTPFAFTDGPTVRHYRQRLMATGRDAAEAASMLDDARTLTPSEAFTDLASVPRFMAWFEGPYGRHTLAAILHDKLIEDEPNSGALRSDVMADELFRDMMGVAGVPVFKRWLMWTAVAARTRWAAAGHRRLLLIVWGVLALIGNALGEVALVALVTDAGAFDHPFVLAGLAAVLAVSASVCWGRQHVAGLLAAAAGLWLVPAAVLVVIGLGVYRASEWLSCLIRPPSLPDPDDCEAPPRVV